MYLDTLPTKRSNANASKIEIKYQNLKDAKTCSLYFKGKEDIKNTSLPPSVSFLYYIAIISKMKTTYIFFSHKHLHALREVHQ